MRNLLKPEIVTLLNFRIQQEELSSRIYNQMSLWLENKGLSNLAKVYKNYSEEELTHAGWASEFLLNFGVTPELMTLPSPYIEYEDLKAILEITLDHELTITKQCEELAEKALTLKNAGLRALAEKYCTEQIDEVGKAIDMLDHFALTTDLLVLDHYVEKYL